MLPKIREVEWLMQQGQQTKDTFVEVHPELLFWALNGRRPIGSTTSNVRKAALSGSMSFVNGSLTLTGFTPTLRTCT
ncbi:MAG: DUF429 domain-containing protein [Chloroflexi bacterium]|nr:DUF429 domain-containing protein [Chloroflexota bacterium]